MTVVELSPLNPLRPPDWRWRRAVHLFDERAEPHRRDDCWTRQALGLVERVDAGGNPPGRRRTGTDIALDDAHALRYAADPRGRWEAEARVLAGQEPAEIAAGLGISSDAVEAYLALFFDIGNRLDRLDYVATFAFGPGVYTGIDPDDQGAVARLLGYNIGPEAVDALVGVWGWPSAARLAPLAAAESARMQRTVELLVATLSLQLDGADTRTFKKLNRLGKELDRALSAHSTAPTSTPIAVEVDTPLVADPSRQDDVSVPLATAPDIFELATHRLSTHSERLITNPALAIAV
jgi:hypothetical protein